MKKKELIVKITSVVVLVALALVSFGVLAGPASDAQTYSHTIEAIDEKKATVMGFTAVAATASTALAAIPGDASTPIANQIMEISEYLFIVVCFLVLEKSLLTVMGYLAFKVLIPAGCLLLALFMVLRRPAFLTWGLKLVVFAIVLALIIPFSVHISDMIYDANQLVVEELTQEFETVEETQPEETVPEETVEEDASLADKIKDALGDAVDKVKDTAQNVTDKVQSAVTNTTEGAKELLNKFIDAIALFIITYCAIPVIVVFVLLWLVKFLFAVAIPMPNVEHVKKLKQKFRKNDQELIQV